MTKLKWHYDLEPNIGKFDKSIRYTVGVLLIAVILFTTTPTLGWYVLFPLLAIPVIVSAYVGWDPIYALFQKRSIRLASMTKNKFAIK